MPIFRHTPDDQIVFDSGSMPLAFFLTLEPAYALPAGDISREYVQGSYHYTWDGLGQTYFDIPYADGDGYIANGVVYLAAYAASLITPPTLGSTKTDKIDDLNSYAFGIKEDYVITADGTFPSDLASLNDLLNQHYVYTGIGALPTGYFVLNTSGTPVAISALNNLLDIITSITELAYYCDIVSYVHESIINSLGSIALVNAYDYEVGWPIVPYVYGITFMAAYYNSINGTSGLGTLTGTAAGGAAIANYSLDLNHGDARYVDYDANLNADAQQIGTIKFVVKPNYSNAPAADMVFFSISEADADITNLIQLTHVNTTGQIKMDIYDQADALITGANFDVWQPAAGQEYEVVFKYDLTSGVNELFIDGTQVGLTNTATGTRSAAIALLRVGSSYNSGAADISNFSIRFFTVYNN